MARLFSLKPIALALSVGFSTAAAAQTADDLSLGSTCLLCDEEALRKEAAARVAAVINRSGGETLPADYTRITADKIIGQTRIGVKAEGEVIIERNDQVLNAQWVEYDQRRDTIKAGDTFVLHQDGTTVQGSRIEYNLTQQTGTADHARLEAEHEGRRLQSVSEQALMKGRGRYQLINTKFNTCHPGDASWYIRADSIEADQNSGIGVAKNASLVFGGVPVLYTPWADFPLNGNRKSGLLVPTVGAGSDGLELELPYYLNLAPNYDATVAPGLISGRGAYVDGEFRYLRPEYSGKMSGRWMPYDRRRDKRNRYQFQWSHQQQLTPSLTGRLDYNQVSDHDYYRDFYGRNDIARNVNLNRQAWLNYRDQVWGGSLSAYLTVQKYQTLKSEDGFKDEPYALLPRLSGRWQKNHDNLNFDLFGQFTRFSHKNKQAGNRAVLYPSVRWDIHNSWGYVRPKIGVHATYYNLDSFGELKERSVSRVLPTFSIDSGVNLERKASWLGKDYLQTLEPRLFYNYIPTKPQNDLPNFDSSENSFNYQQLFRENLYSGNDRINSANSISTAVQTRILNPETGLEYFRAGIGQKFYFKNDNVLEDGSIGYYNRNRSDWVAFANGQVTNSVRVDLNVHYNQNQEQLDSYVAGIRYQPEDGKVLSLRYKYGRNEKIYLQEDRRYFYDKLSQIDMGAQWPLNKNLYAVGRFNYALNVKKPLEMLAGLEYKSGCGCWSASVVAQRYVTGLNSRKNAVFFNLQLKDLSNIGNNPFEQLRLAIPGYRKTNEVVKK